MLLHTPGFGTRSYLRLLADRTPSDCLANPVAAQAVLGLSDNVVQALKNPDWSLLEPDLEWQKQDNNHIVRIIDEDYPPLLKEIADPPPILFVRGNPRLLVRPQIAIVGSRNPSTLGTETATAFARDLSRQGFVITSGLALGIDAASHRGALQGGGGTIAVAGTGPDRVYPARHLGLATEIVNSGALVSEFPPGTTAKANHFPRRNRIISGLCLGLLVVEAAKESGSLITARMALEQNREVFAIPGSIHNPLARGCNALIREGAKLIESTQDILEEFNQYFQEHKNVTEENQQTALDLGQQTLLNRIMFSPTSVDKLVAETGEPVEILSSMLLILELQGYIESTAGGYYTRLK